MDMKRWRMHDHELEPTKELEEVAFQLRGGTDPDGAVSGLEGLTLPEVANVLHSRAARAEELEAFVQRFTDIGYEFGEPTQLIDLHDEATALLED